MRPILLGAALLAFLWQAEKLPVPSQADQKKNEKSIRDLLKDAYQRKDQNSRRQLARTLAETGASEKDPDMAFSYFREAAEVSGGAMDFPTAMGAIERLESLYRVEPESPLAGATFSPRHELRKALLRKAQKVPQTADDAGAFVKAALKLADLYFSEDGFDDSMAVAQMADAVAATSTDKGLQTLVKGYLRGRSALKQEHDKVAKAHLRILADPADGEAAQTWGQFLAFVLGDWDRAVGWLAKGKDGPVAEIGKNELAKLPPAELAEEWLSLADKSKEPERGRYRRRAHHWLEEAARTASGTEKLKAQKRLDDLDKAMGITDLLKLVDPARDYLGKGQGKGGSAKLDGSKLVVEGAAFQNGLVEFPYVPPGDYTLTIVARHAGGEFRPLGLGLSNGDHQWVVMIGINNPALGAVPGVQNVDGKALALDDDAKGAASVAVGQTISCVVTVRPSGFAVSVNGNDVIDWVGDPKRLSVPESMSVIRKNTLFICVPSSRYEIERAIVVPNGMPGQRLR